MKVIKRDGIEVPFDKEKIKRAVSLSATRTQTKLTDEDLEFIAGLAIGDLIRRGFLNGTPVKVDEIHLSVENALWDFNKDLYKEYRSYNNYKKRFNHSFNSILKQAKNIIYEGDKENANKDSCLISTKRDLVSSLVGTELYLEYELPKHLSDAHRNMDIYIHDTGDRFYNSFNCIEENGWITLKNKDGIKKMQLKELGDMLNLDEGLCKLNEKYYVLGRNGWTRLKGVMKRKAVNEDIYTFRSRSGLRLKTTGKHRIPVIRNGEEILSLSKDIQKGDILLTSSDMSLDLSSSVDNMYLNLLNLESENIDIIITNISRLKKYVEYKYGKSLQAFFNEENIIHNKNLRNLSTSQLKAVMNKIEIPYELIMELKIKAKGSKNEFPIFIPVNESLAKLYGYIYADGGIYVNKETSTYQLTFTNTNEDLIDDFIDCFEDVFGLRLSKLYPTTTNSPCIRTTCGSKLLVSLFKGFAGGGKSDSGNISMPDFILSGDKRIKLAYLSSCIDTDGYLSCKSIGYITSSEKYAEQIIQIIQSLGYNPTLIKRYSKGTSYYCGYNRGIRKYDNYIIKINRKEEIFNFYNELSSYKTNDYYEKYEDSKSLKFIETKIVDIKIDQETCYVYDLETESNWFIVNDYVVHNCCLFDLATVLEGGFKLNGKHIEEPKDVEKALDLINDIILVASSQQYGIR